MKFSCFNNWDQLPAGAADLFETSARASIFLSREWLETLSGSVLQEDQGLLLACVVDGEHVLALLPLTVPLQQVERVHWQALSHRYTALFSLLVVEHAQREVIDCLAAGLCRSGFHSLGLEPVAEDDGKLEKLQQAMSSRGCQWHRGFRFYNWIHRTHGQSFDEYLAGRPARLRNTIARKKRKLEREHDSEIRMYRGDDVPGALSDYHAAYSASWKAYEQYGSLLDAMAVRLSEPDWTRLAVLYIDGQPAAAQLWFVVHAQASIFRLAYDEGWKALSPGSILTAWLMQYVIDRDRVEEIDFLTGNERYKQDWMTERRQRYGLVFGQCAGMQHKETGFTVRLRHRLSGLFRSRSA